MDGLILKMETMTDAQAAAWELTVNRAFAVIIFMIVAALFIIWVRAVHDERIEYARAYSDERVRKATERTEKELESWRGIDLDKRIEIRALQDKVQRLERENESMKDLMKRVKAGDLVEK